MISVSGCVTSVKSKSKKKTEFAAQSFLCLIIRKSFIVCLINIRDNFSDGGKSFQRDFAVDVYRFQNLNQIRVFDGFRCLRL